MYSKWTSHLKDPKEKTEFERYVRGSKAILDRVKEMIKDFETTLDDTELSPKQFETPNWAEAQAFKNGSRAAYRTINKLIDLDQQKDNTNER